MDSRYQGDHSGGLFTSKHHREFQRFGCTFGVYFIVKGLLENVLVQKH